MLHWAMWVILKQEFFFDMNKTFVSFNVKNSGNKLPKYQQLVNSLLQDIEMGELTRRRKNATFLGIPWKEPIPNCIKWVRSRLFSAKGISSQNLV
jgi:hypothetical protein